MDQNIDSSGFDQIQPSQVPVIHDPSQEMSKEVLQAKENLMKSIKTFLKRFNRISFGEMPKIINEELAEYINSPSWNRPTFCDNDEEHSIQYKDYLESSSNAIAPVLPTEEPEYSLSMGGGEIDVFADIKDDDYFPFIFVIRIFLPYLIYLEVSPLLLSTGSEDTIFDPGIST
nr:hypothetical protein [Tanacetum cinerariifolium]